ncbi:late embryogenesis abundant protein 6 [Salvia hispanica]|uniref:late embryogenesis abundant protein 6 n=1 Tax=Salvia hispanica TaxID=49212 RepID=UPI0020094E79|nr:late embryogenesis abundant protein 6 [Salvia hispanica]
MQSAKQKAADAAAVAKEHVEILRAKAQEKAEKAAAPTKEGREIAHERRKVKEAEAKMKMHTAKADHAADKLQAAQHGGLCGIGCNHPHRGYQEPYVGSAYPPTVAPAYPPGGYPPGWIPPK